MRFAQGNLDVSSSASAIAATEIRSHLVNRRRPSLRVASLFLPLVALLLSRRSLRICSLVTPYPSQTSTATRPLPFMRWLLVQKLARTGPILSNRVHDEIDYVIQHSGSWESYFEQHGVGGRYQNLSSDRTGSGNERQHDRCPKGKGPLGNCARFEHESDWRLKSRRQGDDHLHEERD